MNSIDLLGVKPHFATPTLVIAALTLPNAIAWPPVSLFMAASAMLTPEGAVSMARKKMLLAGPVFGVYVSWKHCPHVAAFQPGMVDEPPMEGKCGIAPKVFQPCLRLRLVGGLRGLEAMALVGAVGDIYFVIRPLLPSEHATLSILVVAVS